VGELYTKAIKDESVEKLYGLHYDEINPPYRMARQKPAESLAEQMVKQAGKVAKMMTPYRPAGQLELRSGNEFRRPFRYPLPPYLCR
jgi:hypothetical protein